ncbi:MAG: PIN domain-containing protein [Candidatus Nanoarchaeia archaeon]
MGSTKYTLFIDTNIIRSTSADESSPLSTLAINSIIDFAKKNKVIDELEIIIPEIVLDELIHQKIYIYDDDYKILKEIEKRFKDKFNIEGINIKKFEEYDYYSFFRKKCDKFIQEKNIIILPTIDIPSKVYIDRAHLKMPPFNQNKKEGDKGFKDTVIWLSILDYANKNKNNSFIFITNDDIFYSKEISNEFIDEIGKNIIIKKTSNEAINELSEKLKVDLKRKERIKEVKDIIIKEWTDSLINELLDRKYKLGMFDTITSYEAKGVEFMDIEEDNDVYKISSRWELSASTNVRYINYSGFIKPNNVFVKIKLKFEKQTGTIKLINMEPEYPLSNWTLPDSYIFKDSLPKLPKLSTSRKLELPEIDDLYKKKHKIFGPKT